MGQIRAHAAAVGAAGFGTTAFGNPPAMPYRTEAPTPVERDASHDVGVRTLAPRPIDAVAPADDRVDSDEKSSRGSAAVVAVTGYVAVVTSLVLAGLLLTRVLVHGTIGRWDESSTSWLAEHRTATLDTVTKVFSRSADTLGIIAIALVVLIVLAVKRCWPQVAVLFTALVLELSAFLAVNFLVARDRPDVERLGSTPSTGSFPSGHTAATLVLYVTVALVVSATARAFVWQALAWLAAVVMPAAVGFSRVYRGLHHPTDVICGLILGAAVLVVAVLAIRTWNPAEPEPEPEVIRAEVGR